MRKHLVGLTLVGVMIIYTSNAQETSDVSMDKLTFENLLDSMNMSFDTPRGYIETNPIENLQMNYEKVYKHPDKRFEVRYAIRKHNFAIFQQIFEVTVLNISGGQLPNYSFFDPVAVKHEFGADAGAVTMVEVGGEFGQDYKSCMVVCIHQTGVGDGYMFYLADDKEIISELMKPIFHALRFID